MDSNKVTSSIIQNQLPGRDQDDALVIFLKKYYEWCEQNGKPNADIKQILENQDVNTARLDYEDFFRREFVPTAPQSTTVNASIPLDKRIFLKKITEFYRSASTPRSYEFLFNTIFQDTLAIKYPKDTLFSASSAEWIRRASVFIQSETKLNIQTVDELQLTFGNRRIAVTPEFSREISEGVYEVYFTTTKTIPETIEKAIINGLTYNILSTIGQIKVLDSAPGFKLGQLFSIQSYAFGEIIAKIIEVNPQGKIKKLEVIRYNVILPDANRIRNYIQDKQIDYIDEGYVQKLVKNQDIVFYVEQTDAEYLLNNNPVTGFFFDDVFLELFKQANPDRVNEVPTNITQLQIFPRKFANYRGYHANIKGMPSNFSNLLDSDINQEFSYIIESNKEFQEYASLVKETLHPAGHRFAGERLLDSVVSVKIRLESVLSILRLVFEDYANASDEINYKDISKVLFDDVFSQEFKYYSMQKILEDSQNVADENYKDFFKVLSEQANSSDTQAKQFFKVLEEIANSSDSYYYDFSKALLDVASAASNTIYSFQKSLQDIANSGDLQYKDVFKVFLEQTTYSDNQFLDIIKVLIDSAITDDTIQQTVQKFLFDESLISDSAYQEFYKVLSDQSVTTDALYAVFEKTIEEISVATDALTNFVDKNLLDFANSQDIYQLSTNKTLIDQAHSSDFPSFHFYKSVEDFVTAVDAITDISRASTIDDLASANDQRALSLTKLADETVSVGDIDIISFDKFANDDTITSNYVIIARDPYYHQELDSNGINNPYWLPGYLDGEFTTTN